MIKKIDDTLTAKWWHIPLICTQLGFSSLSYITRQGVRIKLLYFSLHMNYLTWSLSAFNFKVKTKLQYNVHFFFYVWVSVYRKSILFKEPTRCNFGSIVY